MQKKLLGYLIAAPLLFVACNASASTWSVLNPLSPGFTYTVYPASDILYFNGNITPQNPANIKTVTETQFGLTPGALTFVSGCDNPTSGCTNATGGASGGTNTFLSTAVFDYLAVHFGQQELLFHWDSGITDFSFTDTGSTFRGLSNYRAYSDGLSQVPLPAAGWLFGSALMGFMGLRRKTV